MLSSSTVREVFKQFVQGATSGTVCGDNFNQEAAAVICKQMGHDHATRWTTRDHKGIQVQSTNIDTNIDTV